MGGKKVTVTFHLRRTLSDVRRKLGTKIGGGGDFLATKISCEIGGESTEKIRRKKKIAKYI